MFPSSAYIKFAISALVASVLGSQLIHNIYKPLSDMDKFIEEELKKLPEDQRAKVRELL